MVPRYINIRFVTSRGPEAWIKSARFMPGDGYKVRSVTLTNDRREAAPMSRAMAEGIGASMWNRVPIAYWADTGEIHAEATKTILGRVASRRRAEIEAHEAFRAIWREAVEATGCAQHIINDPIMRRIFRGIYP